MRLGQLRKTLSPVFLAFGIAGFLRAESSLAQQEPTPAVIINEILYLIRETEHAEDSRAEFVELHNASAQVVDLSGWKFTSGIRFTFAEQRLDPGAYLVVAADLETFKNRYPEVTNVTGPYRGQLSNGGERIQLENAGETVVDRVSYADSGFWARRKSQKLKGYDDWVWEAPHDGGGHSLELRTPRLSNDHGQNWLPSVNAGGTPGKANSVTTDNSAPLISEISHHPPIPNASQEVRVRTCLIDEESDGLKAELFYRIDGQPLFAGLPMSTDGTGSWSASIPPMPDRTVVQFYVEATDSQGLVRQHPQLVSNKKGKTVPQRQALCLYQVEDDFDEAAARNAGAKPTYRLISTKAEWEMIRELNGISGRNSVYDNHIHCTFISVDGVDTQVRYHVTARIRGHGSRANFPPGLRVGFPGDAKWRGVSDINLNSQYTHSQVLGAAVFQLAGFAAARCTPVHLRMNGEDWTKEGEPQFGCYVHNEVLDDEYVNNHFPAETEGNLYRLVGSANLNDRGRDISRYRTLYSKRNHGSKDDYSDILTLIKTLNAKPGPDYLSNVNRIVDIKQWARYIALDALLCNQEGGMSDGRGDDVAMFRRDDGRFQLIPYDLDSIVGLGEQSLNIRKSIYRYGNMQGLRQLFKEPEFMRLYLAQFHQLTETIYNTPVLYRLIDELLGDWIPGDEILKIKEFIPKRIDFIMNQIRSETVIGSTLNREDGIHRASSDHFALFGRFDFGNVKSVTVGGMKPKVFPKTGTWILSPDKVKKVVRSGLNRVPVVMRDYNDAPRETRMIRVLLDRGSPTEISGTLSSENLTWKADEGPYLLKGEVTVAENSTLSIERGTTIYAQTDAKLTVKGLVKAEGVGDQRITFTADPRDAQVKTWIGIEMSDTHDDPHVFENVDLLNLSQGLLVSKGTLIADGITFVASGKGGVVFEEANVTVKNSRFRRVPTAESVSNPLVSTQHGTVHLENCEFERETKGCAAITSQSELRNFRLVGNRFTGGDSPALVMGKGAFIDANDFLTSPSETPLIDVRTDASIIVTRNRVRGKTPLLQQQSSTKSLVAGNQNDQGALPPRSIVTAEALFVQSPHQTAPDAVALEAGGPGVKAIRYRINDGPWTEAPEPIPSPLVLTNLQPGIDYRVALVGQNQLGWWQPEEQATVSAPFRLVDNPTTVRLSEIFSIRGESVYDDYIELHNFGNKPIDLSGFSISDDPENTAKHTFPPGTRLEPQMFRVFSRDVLGFAVSGQGETITLYSPEPQGSRRIDSVTFGLQLPDRSIGLVAGQWTLGPPTPGEANVSLPMGCVEDLRISEWLAVGSASSPDEFVELHNPGNKPVSISGLTLTDNICYRRRWHPFPALSYIDSQSHRSFLADDRLEKGANHLSFRLAKEGEVIGLMDRNGVLIDFAVFGPQTSGVSQGRDANNSLVYHQRPSPGASEAATVAKEDQIVLDSIRISEIHYHPSNGDAEFVELTNIGSVPVPMSGVRFVNGIEFVFPEEYILAPDAYAVLVKQRTEFINQHGSEIPIAGVYSGKLSNAGEKLILATANGDTVVAISYSDEWEKSTDGGDFSLVPMDPNAKRLSSRKNWRASRRKGGSPGRADNP